MENTDAPGVRGEPGERRASGRGRDSPDAHFFFADVPTKLLMGLLPRGAKSSHKLTVQVLYTLITPIVEIILIEDKCSSNGMLPSLAKNINFNRFLYWYVFYYTILIFALRLTVFCQNLLRIQAFTNYYPGMCFIYYLPSHIYPKINV